LTALTERINQNVETYIGNSLAGQPFPAPKSSENHHADLIEQYRASERGDHRAIAALLTIERECAEIDQEATSVDPIPTPAANTVDDRSVDLRAISREIAAYRKATGQAHAVPPQYRASRRARRRSIPPKARRVAPAKPNIRPARARVIQSHASHGGARKRDDCGSGGGDSPPPSRWLLIADISRPRIEVAAVETVNGLATFRKDETTGKPWIETTGVSRAEALAQLSRMVRERGGYPAWEDYA
jgi:hypothetical protein